MHHRAATFGAGQVEDDVHSTPLRVALNTLLLQEGHHVVDVCLTEVYLRNRDARHFSGDAIRLRDLCRNRGIVFNHGLRLATRAVTPRIPGFAHLARHVLACRLQLHAGALITGLRNLLPPANRLGVVRVNLQNLFKFQLRFVQFVGQIELPALVEV